MFGRAWMERAACVDMDIRLFYPSAGNNSTRARKVCSRCGVRSSCLEYAIEQKEFYGIWGGVSESRRRELIQARHGRSAYYSIVKEVV